MSSYRQASIIGIFEKFLGQYERCYAPAEYMMIDEKLKPFRGHYAFRQYIPTKPAKYYIKLLRW